ncbi:MAG TPA: extracellular solute-binding protein [Anaerolineae bacterium]|nr:extracellular solute-binding protein [Anaerolineae bacterium]
MKTRYMMLVSVLLVAAVLLTACPAPATTVAPTQPPAPQATEPPAPQATEPPAPTEPAMEEVSFELWSQEGESEGVFQEIEALAEEYMAEHPNVTITVVQKDTEALREDFQTASLAGAAPQLLWTVNDHAGVFVVADLIQPVDDLVDLDQFVDSALAAVELEGQHWGVPISNGNHLMLLYNKDLLAEAPADTDEMIAAAKELTSGDVYGLVYNATEPFWLVPWLGGFGGVVFADDGKTPTLNTPEMIATLQFLHDLEFVEGIVPPEADYNAADTLFKEGKAAMLINGDWSLGDYSNVLGDQLGVAPIPLVTATGEYPAPYTSGKFFMIAQDVEGAQLEAILDFIQFTTSMDNQLRFTEKFRRLPALKAALDDPMIAGDPILAGSALQMENGTPMPVQAEMRCNWDSMKPEMAKVLADEATPEDAAVAMQAAAENCVQTLQP